MTFSRNYAAVPGVPSNPNAPQAGVIAINNQAKNAAVLPTLFPCPLATEQVIANPALSSLPTPYPLVVTVPSKSIIEGAPFEFLASGVINQQTAAATVTLSLYLGSSETLANNTLLKASAATALVGTLPFWLKARLIADSVSGKLTGQTESNIGNVIGAAAAIAIPAAVVNFATNDPVLSFLLTITPSAANAVNYIKLYEFAINCP
jgi:hypothetical protein